MLRSGRRRARDLAGPKKQEEPNMSTKEQGKTQNQGRSTRLVDIYFVAHGMEALRRPEKTAREWADSYGWEALRGGRFFSSLEEAREWAEGARVGQYRIVRLRRAVAS
jgi:hypothetical protein